MTTRAVLTNWKMQSRPQIFLDGYQVARGWGRKVFPSWPGRHHLHVHVRSWGQSTHRTDIGLEIYAGHLVELDYHVPWSGGPATLVFAPRR